MHHYPGFGRGTFIVGKITLALAPLALDIGSTATVLIVSFGIGAADIVNRTEGLAAGRTGSQYLRVIGFTIRRSRFIPTAAVGAAEFGGVAAGIFGADSIGNLVLIGTNSHPFGTTLLFITIIINGRLVAAASVIYSADIPVIALSIGFACL